ncbi:MAG: DNA gyrase/topoisomerase IV subunit A [Bacteroidales bacterium]|nr:DNA gyrase/topoisomerase IV subunit A [Bacteroidales bacterium]
MSENEENNRQNEEGKQGEENGNPAGHLVRSIHLNEMYEDWFLDYASYVILERAVPNIVDGLKPVHRRILHAMRELDDGRFNKVANIIGHAMKYHPHGDAAIGDALVQLGTKNLLIDTQGNWGNIHTGDSAAAPRYIEARLSKFANEVVFNPKTTTWKASYDGRNKEPLTLPVKFPLLLAQGVEGIAVGLSSRILPHNFNELIDASVRILQGKDFEIYPDFPTGGMADFTKYNEGKRGGRVRIRAKITQADRKTLAITEIPYGSTTNSLIDSIIAANDKGKIKIRKIDDNTAENVEILIHLAPGTDPDTTIDALYAFTNCEVSISPNACVIDEEKPRFLGVKDILKISTENTVDLLKKELEIRKGELLEQLHFSSLEKIFIEERIYRPIEQCETWEEVINTIDKGLDPFKPNLYREVTRDDIIRLTEIKIKRISKYNSFKADEAMKELKKELELVEFRLENLVDFAIDYFRKIKKKYGKGRERKSEMRSFDTIEASMVAAATQKLFVDRTEGFAGTGLKKAEYVADCSDIDDIIVFRKDGTFIVTKVTDKVFVGKDVIHIDIFKRNDERTIYNMVYRDGKGGHNLAKRFAVLGITRDKEYDLTRGNSGSKILYFSANPNGEAEIIKILLYPRPRLKKRTFDFDFSELAIKGRTAKGNILSRYPIQKITKKEEGISTLGGLDYWFDEEVQRLNTDEKGKYLGNFKNDKLFTLMKSGSYKLYTPDVQTHFEDDLIHIEKFDPEKVITAVYYHGEKEFYYVKRFQVEETDKRVDFIDAETGSKLVHVTMAQNPWLEVAFDNKKLKKPLDNEEIDATEFIGIKSYKAKGKRLTDKPVKEIKLLIPVREEEKQSAPSSEEESTEKTNTTDSSDDDHDDGTQQMEFKFN